MDNRKKSPLDVEYTSGGNFYAKKYQPISKYENEILELKSQCGIFSRSQKGSEAVD